LQPPAAARAAAARRASIARPAAPRSEAPAAVARPRRLRALALASALLAAAAAAAAAAAPEPPPLALHACRLPGLEQDARCGTLSRPLDPARPDGPRIALQVAVLPAVARRKQPDPVFFFAGGPGQSAIGLAGIVDALLSRIDERRDIVLIDQRGTGRSAPLKCDTPPAGEAVARMLDRRALFAAMDACRAQLQRLPWGDLRFYTTSLAMDDADAVRAALGAEHIDLVGVSYGTRAALDYLRRYPAHVRRVVLDSVVPPDMTLPESAAIDDQAALDKALRACADEPACARAHPALGQAWQQLLASLPRAADLDDPVTGRPLHATITRDAVLGLVHAGLYAPATAAMLPQAIAEAAAGRFGPLVALGASQEGTGPQDVAEGEHFSVVCSEDAPRMAPMSPADPAWDAGPAGLYRGVCAHWPRGAVPAAFYAIPPSPVPVVLLAGGLDPVTPPRHAERVARALGARARTVVVANAGHTVSALPCLRDAVYRFIDAPDDAQALATSFACAAQVPRPPAFVPPLPARAASADNDPRGYGLEPAARRPAARSPSAPASGLADPAPDAARGAPEDAR
jgi:pimeloyl-ACP methyl ester carboxylesterase